MNLTVPNRIKHPIAFRAEMNAQSPMPPRGGWRPLRPGEFYRTQGCVPKVFYPTKEEA